jgi:hypothetical protein
MPLIRNAEVWFAKLDPKRPNKKFNKDNPTWELQIRTSSKETKKEWEAMNLNVKTIDPDEGPIYYRVNLRKKSIKTDSELASPVSVVDGKLEPVDPNSVGNGSIANIRVYQYEYKKKDGSPGIVSVLMGVQLVKHLVYKPQPRDDEFAETETEVVMPEEEEVEEGEVPY